jgi:hypothetical protein
MAVKNWKLLLFILIIKVHANGQNIFQYNLHDLQKNSKLLVYNRTLTLLEETNKSGIKLSKVEGEGIAWLKDVDFTNGIIEFDVRGENVMQHSFVGIAFHGQSNTTYDAIYLRPFRFQSSNEIQKKHSIQYISLPYFPWQRLRQESPLQYENSIEPSPDPNSWIKMKVTLKDKKISVFINGSSTPSLEVQKVTNTTHGQIGFYVADTSGGEFANLTITNIN